MSASSGSLQKPTPGPCIGFLTAAESELGIVGGYLLLTAAGRPLEFHCTAPVKASRVQEILYGPTLRPFVYSEQIAKTLLAKSRLKPVAVCTDAAEMLAVRESVEIPVVQVLAEAAECGFPLGRNRVSTTPGHAGDEEAIGRAWPPEAEHLDLLEPFTRIREALEEAQRCARQAA
jgi:hypothetical protein